MKWIVVVAVLVLLVAPALAYTEDFQTPNTSAYYVTPYTTGSPTYYYVAPSAGGNGYYWTESDTGNSVFLRNKYAYTMTYAAATIPSATTSALDYRLYTAANATLDTLEYTTAGTTRVGRHEIVVSGSTAYIYLNGNLLDTSVALAQNPSYIGFGCAGLSSGAYWDGMIFGETESKYIFSVPTEEWYYLKKDMLNPAAYGFYYAENDTLISSTTFPATWARSSPNLTGGPVNESIYLINTETGTVYGTYYTGSESYGSLSVPFYTDLVVAGAPYGLYSLKLNSTISDPILYKASGASISFNSDEYNYNDEASITWAVETDYWDTSTYDYVVGLVDAYGAYAENYTLTERTGTFTHTFTSDDEQGAYYAVLIATERTSGDTYWLGVDYAELEAYFNMQGYVNDAETGLPITAANVTITQGSNTMALQITAADGNYTATGGLLGTDLTINTTATGYFQYLASFTPMAYGTKDINITLNSTTPTYTGLGIGGVARDGIFDGTTITSGYGRPISSATCYLKNTSNAELYSTGTNMAGWYLFDEGTSAFLTSARPYDLWCAKTGYGNSPNYTVVAA